MLTVAILLVRRACERDLGFDRNETRVGERDVCSTKVHLLYHMPPLTIPDTADARVTYTVSFSNVLSCFLNLFFSNIPTI